ncbi:MAG TPA: hypothetical protein VFR81_09710, partial [Longimicrobium sp.]|nr:hypothetical protein [Longimicrobium sp.]
RRVRDVAGRAVTFIVITAGCGGEDAETLLQREADFFFQKPLDLARFRLALQRGVGVATRAPTLNGA